MEFLCSKLFAKPKKPNPGNDEDEKEDLHYRILFPGFETQNSIIANNQKVSISPKKLILMNHNELDAESKESSSELVNLKIGKKIME
jgi:hypothetical protein